jgi:hypothetical protein
MINITSTVVEQTSPATSISGTYPAGASGDLLVAIVLDIGVGTTGQATPTGWTLGSNVGQNAVSTNRLRAYWKERAADTDVTFDFTGSRQASLIILNVDGYKHSNIAGANIGQFARFNISGSSAPGTPSFIVFGGNPTAPGTLLEIAWNDNPASTTTMGVSNNFQPVPPAATWSEICRADATGQDLVQVMASERTVENINPYIVTNNDGTNYGRLAVTLFDWPDQTKWMGRLGLDGSTSNNGVVSQAHITEFDPISWATPSTGAVTLTPGTYSFQVRANWNTPLTIGSTRYLSLAVDGVQIHSETYELTLSVTSPQIYFEVDDVEITEDTIVWVGISQGGNSGPSTYDGVLWIEQTEAPPPPVVPTPGFVKKFSSGLVSLFAGSNTEYGSTDGPALDARFTGLEEVAYTWDGSQRQVLNTGNRFYVMEPNKIRLIHLCEDEISPMVSGTYSIDADPFNFFGTGLGIRDTYWTEASEIGATDLVHQDPHPSSPATAYIYIEAGVTITAATATIRWESDTPWNDPYMMQFVFYDADFTEPYTDFEQHDFPGNGETTQTITLVTPYTYTSQGYLAVRLDQGTNPTTDSEAPRGSLVISYNGPV